MFLNPFYCTTFPAKRECLIFILYNLQTRQKFFKKTFLRSCRFDQNNPAFSQDSAHSAGKYLFENACNFKHFLIQCRRTKKLGGAFQ